MDTLTPALPNETVDDAAIPAKDFDPGTDPKQTSEVVNDPKFLGEPR